jgi:hypothetical protein
MSDWAASPVVPSRDFPQRCHIGDYCVLLGQNGATGGYSGGQGLVQVTAVEAFTLLDQHGLLMFWVDTTTATVPAGYGTLDVNGVTSHIAAGGSAQTIGGLQKLQFLHKQFAQLRLRLKFNTAPTGAVDDYDWTVFNPVSTQRGAFAHVNAVNNMIAQSPDPQDTINFPAQGANASIQAGGITTVANPAYSAWEIAASTEQFVLEDNSLGIRLTNNGSAATSAGSAGLEVRGYVYNFANIEAAAGFKPLQFLPTVPLMIPPDLDRRELVPIQIGARNPW